ncbi:Hypothetical protein FKW44_017271 [Caligus rogercresseyi]|uniref:Uncharacterized protein n=1 Tax=Caligus rogercresseyi TaxID=217165 RepID=A0A7T8K1U0_CALRO|nr:Hypothetical protein FKW44_017271 [Caligus rogercresseyi]
MVFISRKDIYGKLKEKKLVESRVEFDSTCRKGNWQSKKGKVAAEAIFEAFDLDHDKKGNLLNKVLKFLNSKPEKADGLEIGAAKRPRINMDMSIDEDDLDVSMYEEPEEITVNKLQEKIKELEGKLAVTTVERDEARAEVTRLENVVKSGQPDPIKSLFGKTMSPTKSNGSGGVKKFQRQMEKIGLQAVSFGVAGRHCNYVLKLVAFELGLEADDVPSTRTLNDWRQKRLPVLIKRQISERILAAEHVGILVDDTALRAPLKMSAIGMVCSSGTYTLVDMVQTDAKNGEQLADQVIRRLELLPQFESFRLKLKYIQSDQGSSQVKANRLIVDHFNNMPERQGLPPLISIYCGLHTIINVDSRLTSYLAASCPKAHELLHNVKILFGCRLRSTWSKSNLTKNLEVLIKMRSPFVTDIGSRIKTTTVNGQALILHEKAVWHAVQSNGCDKAVSTVLNFGFYPKVRTGGSSILEAV